MLSLAWLLRGLLAVGGIATILVTLPVARGAYEAQKADGVVEDLRMRRPVSLQAIRSGLEARTRAIAAEPSATRYFQRSVLSSAAAFEPAVKASEDEKNGWLRQSVSDLEHGLADDPARPVEWLRLAWIRQLLDGPTRELVGPLFMSIETGPLMSTFWRPRLSLILTCWGVFTDAEKARLKDYVLMTWRYAEDRALFGDVVNDPFDEVILRSLFGEDQKVQAELTKLIRGSLGAKGRLEVK